MLGAAVHAPQRTLAHARPRTQEDPHSLAVSIGILSGKEWECAA